MVGEKVASMLVMFAFTTVHVKENKKIWKLLKYYIA